MCNTAVGKRKEGSEQPHIVFNTLTFYYTLLLLWRFYSVLDLGIVNLTNEARICFSRS